MKNLITILELQAKKALYQITGDDVQPEITKATKSEFGHYQCNNALKLAKKLKKNPKSLAEEIIKAWPPLEKAMILKMEIAGAGFINIFLTTEFISEEASLLLQDPLLGIPPPTKKEKIVIDFSSPNIAKELHVGHLRSTIIGDSLARLFEFLGHDVLRLNHIGDWGTQFGMLIAYTQENGIEIINKQETTDISSLMEWYKKSKKKFDNDTDFKLRAQLQVVKLQNGDTKALKTWETICSISKRYFEEIYKLLDVVLITRGESFYNPFLPDLIKDLENKGIITSSEGAKCIYLDEYKNREGSPLPIIIQKTDGGYNYDTTDLAALKHRITTEKASRIIVVTDAGQALHFEMLIEAAKKAGYLDPKTTRFDHVTFGVVLGPDGKKFKTRSGETEKLIDLLQQAIDEAKNLLQERLPFIPPQELADKATILGIDAIKYADLSSNRIRDYVFSYDRMLRFEGNTAVFVLYAYVRIESIKKKINKPIHTRNSLQLHHPSEIALALHLRQLGETIEIVSNELTPHHLAEYLYETAEKFHAFFRDCHVENSPTEESRLLLCEITSRILKQGLKILGLKTLDKM
jgi:arginyl-tRNA synthetase